MVAGVKTVGVRWEDRGRAVEVNRDAFGRNLLAQQPQWTQLDANGVQVTTGSALTTVRIGPIVGRVSR